MMETPSKTHDAEAYLLIELGAASERFRQKYTQAMLTAPHVYLFEGTPEASIAVLGPLLIESQSTSVFVEEVSAWNEHHPTAIHHIMALVDLPTLAQHLRNRLTVLLPDESTRLFRFYDPLTLPLLHKRLDDQQHETFWSPIQSWRFHLKEGGVELLSPLRPELPGADSVDSETSEPSPFLPLGHFRLSVPLWRTIQLEADLRQVRALIVRDPEFRWFSGLSPEEQEDVYRDVVDAPLRQSGLAGTDDLHTAAVFCMRYPSTAFGDVPNLQKAIDYARHNQGELQSAIVQFVPREAWLALE